MSITRHRAGGEVRAKGDGRTVEARVVSYNVVDDYRSVFMPGCFTESLNRRLPVFAWSHDWSDPIGVGVSWRDDRDGPYVTFRISDPDAVPRARQAVAQIADGTMRDVSVGFSHAQRREPTDAERKRFPGAVEMIERAELDETSCVMRGAVPGAEIAGVRSADGVRGYRWHLSRQYAEGRITRAEFERAVALEREVDEALDKVQAHRLRHVEANLDQLTAAERVTWMRAQLELLGRQAKNGGRR